MLKRIEEPPVLLTSPHARDLERLTARVVAGSARGAGARLDTYREGDTFFIDIDLPGVDPASIDITVDGKVLTVRAERRPGPGMRHPEVAGRPAGAVARQVRIAETLDTDRLEARHDNGVLTLSIPVLEPVARKVEVSGGTAAS